MVLALIAGVVNVLPVNTGVPPIGVVYHLNVALGVVDDAVKVVVSPALTVRVGGVTVISGLFALLPLSTLTVPVALFADTAPVVGLIASA